MSILFKTTPALLFLTALTGTPDVQKLAASSSLIVPIPASTPKIQAAILLDVSNSMDGLMEQAKAQLWNMVSIMGKAKCNEVPPQIEIALYEYGSPRNPATQGYVKQISAFTTDLDQLSKNLFALTTRGGDEYCGHVIYSSINELAWDTAARNYKVIFIAGNEDFLQGDISYTKACAEARKKGIIVNTIYCGDKQRGIAEHWNLGAECGTGSFTHIDQDARPVDIPTPYDSALMVLNERLNGTYVAYGASGVGYFARQAEVDQLNNDANKSIALKRVAVKADKNLYKNSSWDMVDAATDDSSFISKVDINTLPDSLKNKTRPELLKIIKAKKAERSGIQKQIQTLNQQREEYLIAERKKRAADSRQTLETEIEKIIRQQASRFNMVID